MQIVPFESRKTKTAVPPAAVFVLHFPLCIGLSDIARFSGKAVERNETV
jgi:hypothetical protein